MQEELSVDRPMAPEPLRNRNPRSIAIVWAYLQSYHLARLSAFYQAARRRDFEVLALEGGPGGASRDSHVLEICQPTPFSREVLGSGGEHLDSPQVARRLVAWMERVRPAVIFLPGYGNRAARTALRACRRLGTGAVIMFETQERDLPRTWWREWIKRWLLRRADVVFCGGESHAAYAVKLGVPLERVIDGYDVVDNAFWSGFAEEGRRSSEPGDGRVVLAAGRFIAKKNFVGLIRAFAAFHQTAAGRGHRLVLIGDGPERAAIVREAERLDVTSVLAMPGYLSSKEIARWMGRAECFVVPSSHEEQWGLVVNEAMAAGLPSIVSDICGCVPDLIKDGTTGLLFDPRSLGSLVSQLSRLAGSGDLRSNLSNNCRQHISRYSLEYFSSQALRAAEIAISRVNTRPLKSGGR